VPRQKRFAPMAFVSALEHFVRNCSVVDKVFSRSASDHLVVQAKIRQILGDIFIRNGSG
jgi:hypothetical protein